MEGAGVELEPGSLRRLKSRYEILISRSGLPCKVLW